MDFSIDDSEFSSNDSNNTSCNSFSNTCNNLSQMVPPSTDVFNGHNPLHCRENNSYYSPRSQCGVLTEENIQNRENLVNDSQEESYNEPTRGFHHQLDVSLPHLFSTTTRSSYSCYQHPPSSSSNHYQRLICHHPGDCQDQRSSVIQHYQLSSSQHNQQSPANQHNYQLHGSHNQHPPGNLHHYLLPISCNQLLPDMIDDSGDESDEVFTSADQEVRQVMSATIARTRQN